MTTAIAESNATALSASAPVADFNRLAHLYRWMEWITFGPFLGRCRSAFLADARRTSRAIVIGDGDGRFTAKLLKENATIQIDAVDASAAMLNQLSKRAEPHADRIRTHLADARHWNPANRDNDLFVTHFFLDCLSTREVTQLAARLKKHATPDAAWIISEFAVPAGWYGRAIARPLIAALYCAFAWLTGLKTRHLPDHPAALTSGGWKLAQRRTSLGGLLVSELWRAH
jgi:SAM-dependent methyltransferase